MGNLSLSESFIGIGEKWALSILKGLTNLQELNIRNWPDPGIYIQVPMRNLIKLEYYETLSQPHRRSSADIVVITNQFDTIVVRIQGKGHGEGHKGLGKSHFDSVQRFWLEESQNKVINFTRYEHPNLLKEIDIVEAKKEIIFEFTKAGFEDLVKFEN